MRKRMRIHRIHLIAYLKQLTECCTDFLMCPIEYVIGYEDIQPYTQMDTVYRMKCLSHDYVTDNIHFNFIYIHKSYDTISDKTYFDILLL
jgi:hypothetical protein